MKYKISMNTTVVTFFAAILSVLLLASCAEKRPEKVETKEEPARKEVRIKEDKPEKPEEKTPSLFEVLVKEARKFIRAGQMRDALVFYNKALSLASESEKKEVMENVRDILARADTPTLRELSRTEELFIPKAPILYRLASSQALEENYKEAAKTIETFEKNIRTIHLPVMLPG